MDFVRRYFRANEPLTSWTLLSSLFFQISADLEKKVRTKGFNWSEVHLYWNNFLQNPYFNRNSTYRRDTTVFLILFKFVILLLIWLFTLLSSFSIWSSRSSEISSSYGSHFNSETKILAFCHSNLNSFWCTINTSFFSLLFRCNDMVTIIYWNTF